MYNTIITSQSYKAVLKITQKNHEKEVIYTHMTPKIIASHVCAIKFILVNSKGYLAYSFGLT